MELQHKDHRYQKGLECFNSAQFYEAHEHWEEVWLEIKGPDKSFLQGLIQVAAAFHHYSRANLTGTRKLLRKGLSKLNRVPEVHGGLEIDPLRGAVREWLAALESGKTPARSNIPRIRTPDRRTRDDSHKRSL
jgi:uncharacterized protein